MSRKNSGEVGYGRPPKAHQFKPGKSGNPRGRPKGSKNEATILKEILDRKIKIRTDGGAQKKSIREVILLRIAEHALKGDIKSAAFVLNRYAAMVSGDLQPQDLSEEDREVLEAFARRAQQPATSDEEGS